MCGQKYCEELGIELGDILLEIDGQVIEDIFDYQFYVESEEPLVVIRKANGEEWELKLRKMLMRIWELISVRD